MDEKAIDAALGAYSVTTPYGVVRIMNRGRVIQFELYDDIHQSRHNLVLYRYVKWLHDVKGVDRINCDHVTFPWLNRTMQLRRGSRKLDIVYEYKGRLHECELKTEREVGLDTTARQIQDYAKQCKNLIVLVPLSEVENMQNILKLINLDTRVKVDTYEVEQWQTTHQ